MKLELVTRIYLDEVLTLDIPEVEASMATFIRSRQLMRATSSALSLPLLIYSGRQQCRSFSLSEPSAAVTSSSVLHDEITLYQYRICPYCARPKTFLDFLKVFLNTHHINLSLTNWLLACLLACMFVCLLACLLVCLLGCLVDCLGASWLVGYWLIESVYLCAHVCVCVCVCV